MPRNNADLTDIQDLLDIVSGTRIQSIDTSPLVNFINFYKIESGNQKIEVRSLHSLYDNYCKTKTSLATFKKHLNKYVTIDRKDYALINRASYDQLIRFINEITEKKAPTKYKIDSIKNFINSTGVKSGENWIEDYIFYHWFMDWKGKNSKRGYKFELFINMAKLHFPYKHTAKVFYFGLSEECHTYLTPARLRALRSKKINHEKETRSKKRQVRST